MSLSGMTDSIFKRDSPYKIKILSSNAVCEFRVIASEAKQSLIEKRLLRRLAAPRNDTDNKNSHTALSSNKGFDSFLIILVALRVKFFLFQGVAPFSNILIWGELNARDFGRIQ